ncbi:MAG: hypothetical protein U5K69_11670 [Balneolaceae bacterium]|nr:hypothetical protein [Balneolaceae bacterium]
MAKISGKSSKPLMLNNPTVKTEIVGNFDETELRTFDYTGAIDVYEVLSNVIAESDADAVTNLTITLKSDVGTFFLNLVTLGIANAYRVGVTGDLVNLPEGMTNLDVINKNDLTSIQPDPNSEVTVKHFDGILMR